MGRFGAGDNVLLRADDPAGGRSDLTKRCRIQGKHIRFPGEGGVALDGDRRRGWKAPPTCGGGLLDRAEDAERAIVDPQRKLIGGHLAGEVGRVAVNRRRALNRSERGRLLAGRRNVDGCPGQIEGGAVRFEAGNVHSPNPSGISPTGP